MELFNLEVSKWGIDLQTYFGDVYLYHRAWLTALGIIVVLRGAKLIRSKARLSDLQKRADDTNPYTRKAK